MPSRKPPLSPLSHPPVLALLTPLLERSLNTPTTPQEVLRQTVVVIENLTKLVHDPIEARAFLPKLQPGVKSVKDRASLPEVRELASRALAVMEQAMADKDGNTSPGAVARTAPSDVVSVLEGQMEACGNLRNLPGDADVISSAKKYVAEMVAENVNQRRFQRLPQCISPYLDPLMNPQDATKVAEAVHRFYLEEDNRKFGQPVQEDDGEVEIVNATFSLGYGGMLLLSQTCLRLLKGHRYGLCGRNGAGKSTLMRSIAEGKLEGFPSQDEVKTCFVEHNQGRGRRSQHPGIHLKGSQVCRGTPAAHLGGARRGRFHVWSERPTVPQSRLALWRLENETGIGTGNDSSGRGLSPSTSL